MRWLIEKNGENTGEVFDDGIVNVGPGEEGFTYDLINAELDARRAADPDNQYSASFASITWPPAEPEE